MNEPADKCQGCGGTGRMFWEEPHYERVTRDMATDAQDPQPLLGE